MPAAFLAPIQPTIVVIPFRTHEYAIKGWLLESGLSFLGIRFVTPRNSGNCSALARECALPLREHLRLLLASAAEKCMDLPKDPALREKRMLEADFLAAKSVKRGARSFTSRD